MIPSRVTLVHLALKKGKEGKVLDKIRQHV